MVVIIFVQLSKLHQQWDLYWLANNTYTLVVYFEPTWERAGKA